MKTSQTLDERMRDKWPKENRMEAIANEQVEESRKCTRAPDKTLRETKLSQARDLSDMSKWKKPKRFPMGNFARVCVLREKRWNFVKKLFVHDSVGNRNACSPVGDKKTDKKDLRKDSFIKTKNK